MQGQFLAPLRAIGNPGIGDRRRAEALFGQVQQASGDGIGNAGDDAPEDGRALTAAGQVEPQLGQFAGQCGEGAEIVGTADAVGEMDAADPLGTQQVGAADQTVQLARFGDRQVVDAAPGHFEQGFEAGGVRRQRAWLGGHDRRDRHLVGKAGSQAAAAQVAVGDDAEQAAFIDDEQGRHAFAGHAPGGLANAGFRAGAYGRPADQRRQRQAAEVAFERDAVAVPGTGQALAEVADGALAQFRVLLPECRQMLQRQTIKQGVLDSVAGPGLFRRVGQAVGIVHVAFTHAPGQGAFRGPQFDGALTHQPQAGLPFRRETAAAAQVTNDKTRRQRGQRRLGEAVERRALGHEVADFGQFVVHGSCLRLSGVFSPSVYAGVCLLAEVRVFHDSQKNLSW
jgi:hypothetical protein